MTLYSTYINWNNTYKEQQRIFNDKVFADIGKMPVNIGKEYSDNDKVSADIGKMHVNIGKEYTDNDKVSADIGKMHVNIGKEYTDNDKEPVENEKEYTDMCIMRVNLKGLIWS